MLVSAGGMAVVDELHLFGFLHADETARLDFGALETLVSMMQDTPADALIPKLKSEVAGGTDLRTLAAAAALANARTFGGQDYTGYHCFMAIVPALAMAARMKGDEALLPVFKVLHRNARQIQSGGGRSGEVLKKVAASETLDEDLRGRLLAEGRKGGFDSAEAMFASVAAQGPEACYHALQPLVRDNIDVHQVVLAYRSWDMMRLAGEENAHVLLRQVLRHCIDRDEGRRRRGRDAPAIRTLLPELMQEHGLDRATRRERRLDRAALDELARDIFSSSRDDAARRVAAELGAGVSRDDIGEALSLAAVRLLLHDPGRSYDEKGKPKGSVHGASVGLHAADSANAWRGIAAVTNPVDADASLVTAAWHGAGQSGRMDHSRPFHADAREAAGTIAPGKLLDAMAEGLRGGEQQRSSALAERYLTLGRDPEPLISALIGPATEFDGALHHEKFFHTATVEFERSRPEFRHEHLVALTRVMASGYGFRDEGLQVSRRVLGLG
jgi:hypothetical protein